MFEDAEEIIALAIFMCDFTQNKKASSYSIPEYAKAQEAINAMLTFSQPQLIQFLKQEPVDDVVFQAAQIHELVQFLMANQNTRVLTQPVVLPEFDLSVRSKAEIPTKLQALHMQIQSINALLRMLPSMSMVSISECKSILVSESSTVLALLRRLLNYKGSSFTMDAVTLTQVIPQITSALIRVIPSLPKDAQALINVKGIEYIKLATEILNDSTELANPKNAQQFHSNVLKLYSTISSVNAICNEEFEVNPIDILYNLKTAIDNADIDDLTQCFLDIKSINARSKVPEFKDINKLFNPIQKQIDEIEPIIYDLNAKQLELTEPAKQKLDAIKPILIKIISESTRDPMKDILTVKTIKLARDSILTHRA